MATWHHMQIREAKTLIIFNFGITGSEPGSAECHRSKFTCYGPMKWENDKSSSTQMKKFLRALQ